MRWGALSKIILNDNDGALHDLLKSITGDIHARLKDLSLKIDNNVKFQKILKLIDDLLKKEMDSWEEHFKIKNETEDQKKLRS